MELVLYTGNYKVIDSKTVFLYDIFSNLEINISFDDCELQLKIIFVFTDCGDEQGLTRAIEGNTITFNCIKFENKGTGSNKPIDLIEVNGKKLYIHFWAYKPTKTVRKVEYTILSER